MVIIQEGKGIKNLFFFFGTYLEVTLRHIKSINFYFFPFMTNIFLKTGILSNISIYFKVIFFLLLLENKDKSARHLDILIEQNVQISDFFFFKSLLVLKNARFYKTLNFAKTCKIEFPTRSNKHNFKRNCLQKDFNFFFYAVFNRQYKNLYRKI